MFVVYVLYKGIIIPVVIAALCGAAAAALFFIIRNKKRGGSAKPTKKQLVAQGIQNNIGDFSGLFEPVYSVANGKNKRQQATFAAWNDAVQNSEEDNGYKAIFNDYFGDYESWGKGKKKVKVKKQNKIYKKKSKKLLKIFKKGDIVRSSDLYAAGAEDTAEKFSFAGDGSIETDAQYEVLAPCWTYQDKIVDKGVIR
ncbi:MAG: hypothetical protein IJS90_05220 [Clostridia bacterium]|nr:hypothetical protein [Clostridia bacterium]